MKQYRLQGSKIEVLGWKLDYQTADGDAAVEYELTREGALARQAALETEGCGAFALTQADTGALAWMNGIDVGRQSDPMAEADRIFAMGEEAYLAEKNAVSVDQQLMLTQLQQQEVLDALLLAQLGGNGNV